MKLHTVCNEAMERLLVKHRRSFVGYLTAGYPDEESFLRIAKRCQQEGMHIFEIGYPSLNPYSDGEVIRRAHSAVDPALRENMGFWKRLRQTVSAPIWLMGYTEDLMDTGMYRRLAEAGCVDALVIPDLEHSRRMALKAEMEPFRVEVLGFTSASAAPRENEETLHTYPIIYQQLYSGPTGMQNDSEDYQQLLSHSREVSSSHLFAGFGIGTPQRAKELLQRGFDGVIIGTAIMKRLAQSEEELYAFIRQLVEAVESTEAQAEALLTEAAKGVE